MINKPKQKSVISLIKNNVRINKVSLGENVKYYDFINLYGCTIGDDVKIGTFVEIQKNVVIGKRCKISSHTFICEGVIIGDDVFIGHGVMFINDKYPRAAIDGKQIVDEWKLEKTFIGNGVSIGSNATILPGITIEDGAIIGAGAVVTKNVKKNSVTYGNPAKSYRKIKK